jgi:HEAT repeat protein
VKALLVALGAQEPELRAQAAISLGELQSKEGIPFLLTCMLNDPDIEVRTSATYGLGLFFEDRTEPAQEQVTQTLISVLSNERESPKVRGQAAEALANRGDHQALFPLQTALDDASVEVRFWAVFALGQLGDPYALTALERVAATDQAVLPGWWSISKEARDAIQQIQERQSDENRER